MRFCTYTYIQTLSYLHAYRQIDKQTVRHTYIHTYKHTYIHTCTPTYIRKFGSLVSPPALDVQDRGGRRPVEMTTRPMRFAYNTDARDPKPEEDSTPNPHKSPPHAARTRPMYINDTTPLTAQK